MNLDYLNVFNIIMGFLKVEERGREEEEFMEEKLKRYNDVGLEDGERRLYGSF